MRNSAILQIQGYELFKALNAPQGRYYQPVAGGPTAGAGAAPLTDTGDAPAGPGYLNPQTIVDAITTYGCSSVGDWLFKENGKDQRGQNFIPLLLNLRHAAQLLNTKAHHYVLDALIAHLDGTSAEVRVDQSLPVLINKCAANPHNITLEEVNAFAFEPMLLMLEKLRAYLGVMRADDKVVINKPETLAFLRVVGDIMRSGLLADFRGGCSKFRRVSRLRSLVPTAKGSGIYNELDDKAIWPKEKLERFDLKLLQKLADIEEALNKIKLSSDLAFLSSTAALMPAPAEDATASARQANQDARPQSVMPKDQRPADVAGGTPSGPAASTTSPLLASLAADADKLAPLSATPSTRPSVEDHPSSKAGARAQPAGLPGAETHSGGKQTKHHNFGWSHLAWLVLGLGAFAGGTFIGLQAPWHLMNPTAGALFSQELALFGIAMCISLAFYSFCCAFLPSPKPPEGMPASGAQKVTLTPGRQALFVFMVVCANFGLSRVALLPLSFGLKLTLVAVVAGVVFGLALFEALRHPWHLKGSAVQPAAHPASAAGRPAVVAPSTPLKMKVDTAEVRVALPVSPPQASATPAPAPASQ